MGHYFLDIQYHFSRVLIQNVLYDTGPILELDLVK